MPELCVFHEFAHSSLKEFTIHVVGQACAFSMSCNIRMTSCRSAMSVINGPPGKRQKGILPAKSKRTIQMNAL